MASWVGSLGRNATITQIVISAGVYFNVIGPKLCPLSEILRTLLLALAIETVVEVRVVVAFVRGIMNSAQGVWRETRVSYGYNGAYPYD